MKWFKHDTDTSSDPKIKLLRKKFGAEGLWVYFEINRLIALNVSDDIIEWGYLAKEYTDHLELLAEEVCVDTVQKLHSICEECVTLGLLYRNGTRILNPKILLRADRYTEQKAKENSLNLEEYVQKLYRICTESTPRREEKRREKKRKEEKIDAGDERRQSSQEEKKEKTWERIPPDKQTKVQRLVYHLEDTLHTKITNWGKQGEAVKLMEKAGYTEEQIKKAITYMATKDDFFRDKGFDLMTVTNAIPRLKAESEKRRAYATS